MPLSSALDDRSNKPSFPLGKRTALLYQDKVANLTLIVRVMGHVFHTLSHVFPIELVRDLTLYKHNNAFVHFITDHGPLTGLFRFVTHMKFQELGSVMNYRLAFISVSTV